MTRKKICISVPTYNEVENIGPLVEIITQIFQTELAAYDYQFIFADNKSTDGTREWIVEHAKTDKHIKAIFNSTNLRPGSGLNLIRRSEGDCVIFLAADLQDPPELIPQFVRAWEEGHKIVIGVKTKSEENFIMFAMRGLFYKVLKAISETPQIEQFTGFGLYDREWMEFVRTIKDPAVYMRGVIAKYGFERKEIEFVQPKRERGQSKSEFMYLYRTAMTGITAYSDLPLQIATITGFLISVCVFIVAIVYLIYKLIYWNQFQAGIAPLIISTLFIGSVILFFIGLLGEYIININKRVMHYPFVLEEQLINFEGPDDSPDAE
jgi:polyisoprenyl-phosphate glycosyltransferase